MAFHFKKSESAAKAARRACRECIETALKLSQKLHHPTAVHGMRKEIKKLRAIFRLVRPKIGCRAYRKGNNALRKGANSLAAPRDAQVMFKAFKKLTRHRARRFAVIEITLQNNWERQGQRFWEGDAVAQVKGFLFKARRHAERFDFKGANRRAIMPGLKKSYRRGRRALKLAAHDPEPAHFHGWRKEVKRLEYYFRLLGASPQENLNALGELLGDEHDLVMLQQFVVVHGEQATSAKAGLNRLIKSQRTRLRSESLKLGAKLYAATPKAMCRRLEECPDEGLRARRRTT